ncbi:MAG: pitrilysin family protein [Bacteroidota bacterium]|nr:pitrilysin family protein [Bacteroidota bacterium]MDP4217123.1 pitrilysin family protein [Bacteroidota bacterium]MDP4247554.1 pitrilysin family protein [Bacteroidota bacterium]MDP4252595.1 pitrilysin family protein [Bacteroidota bacterium]MDP4258443.1 pitrilysin family protein [Bacteroidota bacterium]
MIQFERFQLANGLRVLVHEDRSTPMAVVNVLYDVGARDEDPNKTGFAHLFEHLMFGGSANIPDFETPLQLAGGENNAYTTNDFTNYYIQLPAENMETAFWLESDRMVSLAFSEKSLEVQRKVVCEEFKEHYINKPYGDAWFKMRELVYTRHPYRWMTIGKELAHIEQAKLRDVKDFFFKYYRPVNAVLVVAGNVHTDQVRALAEKWFGDIDTGEKYIRNLPAEPKQHGARRLEVKADVPLDALYKCYPMAARTDPGYYVADLISEVLGGGASSRLHQSLIKEKKLFSQIECYHTGSTDPGLVVIEGKLIKGIRLEDADKAVEEEIARLLSGKIEEKELMKVKNKTESAILFEDMSVMNRANSLAIYELLGDANMMNTELARYQAVTADEILATGREIFHPDNSNTMYYNSIN